MNFYILDAIFLIFFIIFLLIFLFKNKKKLKREGIFFLYRTKKGLNFIDKFSRRNKKLIYIISYFSIFFGYLFLIISIFLFLFTLKIFYIAKTVPNIPPIIPIFPYITEIFKIKFLPPFYFIYWIIIILIIAVSHEFAHGIFARAYDIKIKSTGFGFLGPFILAFVEPDEKEMNKKKIKNQLAILSAGSFANFLVALIFILILQIFFLLFYQPIGVHGYFLAIEEVNISNLGINLNNSNYSFPIKFEINNNTYYLTKELWESQKDLIIKGKSDKIILYIDSPAYKANLTGAIIEVDGKKVEHIREIIKILENKKPGDKIKIKTEIKEYEIELTSHPKNLSKGFLGISFVPITNKIMYLFLFQYYKFNPYLKTKAINEIFDFFRDLFYWIAIIGLSVAFFNMLPFGFLDGGKSIYLTFLLIFKNKKIASILYNITNAIIIFILFLLMFFWFIKLS
ncbi:MAG: site-2 protease family protein [Candidatus Pacearchaeota archaeon]